MAPLTDLTHQRIRASGPTSWLMGVLIVTILAAASCDDADSQRTTPLTKAEWIAEAESICREAKRDLAEYMRDFFPEDEPDAGLLVAAPEFWQGMAPIMEGELDRLRELKLSKRDTAEVNKILEAGQQWLDEIREASRNKHAAVRMVEFGSKSPGRFEESLVSYGAERCGPQKTPRSGETDETAATQDVVSRQVS